MTVDRTDQRFGDHQRPVLGFPVGLLDSQRPCERVKLSTTMLVIPVASSGLPDAPKAALVVNDVLERRPGGNSLRAITSFDASRPGNIWTGNTGATAEQSMSEQSCSTLCFFDRVSSRFGQREITDLSSRHAREQAVRSDRAGHHRPGSYHRAGLHARAGKQNDSSSYPATILDHDVIPPRRTGPLGSRAQAVRRSSKHHFHTDGTPFTNADGAQIVEHAALVDERATTYCDVPTTKEATLADVPCPRVDAVRSQQDPSNMPRNERTGSDRVDHCSDEVRHLDERTTCIGDRGAKGSSCRRSGRETPAAGVLNCFRGPAPWA